MPKVGDDITRSVFSAEHVRKNMSIIFPDAIILDLHFNVVSLSENICQHIGYHGKELRGRPISILSSDRYFQQQLQTKLAPGFFDECHFELRRKTGHPVRFALSGFYLGLITDINEYIILKFKNLDEVNFLKTELEIKSNELDEFVYHSAHHLRGPLATLKGLINLLKTNSHDPSFLVSQMDIFANILDKKLFQLMDFSESDKTEKPEETTLLSIGDKLQNFVSIISGNRNTWYEQYITNPTLLVANGTLVFNLLQNITSFFCQQNILNNKEIYFKASSTNSSFELELIFRGVRLQNEMIEQIKTVNFGYTQILQEDTLTNLYSAKKIAEKLKGRLYFTVNQKDEILVYIIFPK